MLKRLWLVLGLLGALVPNPGAASQPECFAATPYCLDDPLRDFWHANGGLPVFGYPTSPPLTAINQDLAAPFAVQWMERNRLELHPENAGTPYAVLLGLLGKELLAGQQPDWAAQPREAGPQADCLWFEATGHNVCDQAPGLGFKSYWSSHGLADPALDAYAQSLQLFGLPLTAPRLETNLSGDTVLTQWFERARFEWHPANPEASRVLLGRLGAELYTYQPIPSGAIAYAQGPFTGEVTDIVVFDRQTNLPAAITSSDAGHLLTDPVFSPDGQRIAFVSADYTRPPYYLYRLELINGDGSQRQSILQSAYPLIQLTWAPDGTQLAFSSRESSDGGFDIYTIKADGSGLRNQTNSPANDLEPDWSPDGSRLVYSSNAAARPNYNADYDLYTLELDSASITRISRDPNYEGKPRWSPDGQQIAYWGSAHGGVIMGGISDGMVQVLDLRSGERRVVVPASVGGADPAWSPDGQYLAFTTKGGPNNFDSEIAVIGVDGNNLTMLTQDELNQYLATWH